MNIFKSINVIVQNLAKFIAFVVAFAFTFISWAIYKINAFVMVTLAILIWLVHGLGLVLNTLSGWIMFVPSKISMYAFLFALDISPAENKERMETLMKQIEDKAIKEKIRLLKEAGKSDADFGKFGLDPNADFQRGQEAMKTRAIVEIARWGNLTVPLVAGSRAGVAQTIQELVRTLSIEPTEEQDTDNDPS